MKFYALFYVCLLVLHGQVFAADDQYVLVISKSLQEMRIMNGDEIVKQFYVAHGRGGKGTKKKQGDKKTPLGTYEIVALKDSDKFHYFMHINYPSLPDTWAGYKDGIINADELHAITTAIKKNDVPPQNTKLGGFIGLHGLGRTTKKKLAIHNALNWTEGCIAMTNEQIDHLRKYARVGTKIVIIE